MLLTDATPGGELPDPFQTLFLVNDEATPDELHIGGKDGVAADGYPTTLEPTGRPLAAP